MSEDDFWVDNFLDNEIRRRKDLRLSGINRIHELEEEIKHLEKLKKRREKNE